MAKIYTGINNYNEYYTNHYFSSIFEENAAARISEWRDSAKISEGIKTPWSMLKEDAKSYYTAYEKYLRTRSNNSILLIIKEMADKYLKSLGYDKAEPFIENIDNEIKVPIYKEIKLSNGNPLLWIILSQNKEDDEDVLYGNVFDGNIDEETYESYINTDINCEDLVTKSLFANDNPPRWIIVIGINGISLIDRNKWNEKRYLGFDLKEIFSRREDSCLQAMAILLHKESLCPDEGISLLDDLNENSNRHAAGISQDLKYALRECIELLGNEVLYYFKNNEKRDLENNPIDASELTMQCLRYMYRMLFVLFIEARPELGYAPMKDIAYVTGYSLETLRDIVDEINEDIEEIDNGYYLGDSINKLFNIIYYGYPSNQEELINAEKMESIHDAFVIEPLKAHIFDPELTNMISKIKLRNSVMIKIIKLMSISRNNRTGRGRISYSNLGINQLGSVYEALLSYRGFIAEHTLYEVKRAGDAFDELEVGYFIPESELNNYTEEERVRYEHGINKGKPRKYEKGTFIYRLAGREREKSASYYTPEVLTKCLVKYALKELLKGKSADDILNLTICEPAMGSAAFLNEAINQLAESYINKKQEELGELIPYEERYDQIQKVKMYIADRNIYGVDLNPTAVELAEVSLWLNTICKGGYVPWFGTQIVNGNSLIGARRQVYNTEQLSVTNTNLRWYNYAPERLKPGTIRSTKENKKQKKQIYHFLTGDPGMCCYNDKVIKELEKENIAYMKNWNKQFTESYNQDEIESLLRISSIIDNLWDKQIELRKEVKEKTADKLFVYGREDNIEGSHTTIRQKDMIYRQLYKSEKMENAGPYARLKFAMDYWCALWFWPIDKAELLPSRSEYIYDMSLILEGGIMSVKQEGHEGKFTDYGNGKTAYQTSMFDADISSIAQEIQKKYDDLGHVNIDKLCETEERLALVRKIANQNHFMHWELEFADLFEEKGGFDLMIGNPPWIKVTWNEHDLLSEYNPSIVIKKISASVMNNIRDKMLNDNFVKDIYKIEYVAITGSSNYYNAICNYNNLKGSQTNLYKCFLTTSYCYTNQSGTFSFIHPDSIFDDPTGSALRKTLYPKLKRHFQFINEKLLFADVGHPTIFSLNVYSNKSNDGFDCIFNLFDPATIEKCYDINNENNKLPGLKNDKNEWDLEGHPDRIIHVDDETLKMFGTFFEDFDNYSSIKLPALHCKQLLNVIKKISNIKNKIKTLNRINRPEFMWHETYSVTEGIIKRNTHFSNNDLDCIISGPNIGIANSLYKSPRRICESKGDFDKIDLEIIPKDYLYRSNYSYVDKEKYINRCPITDWSTNYIDHYRLVGRRMLNLKQERTLMCAIIPPQIGHIFGLTGFAFKDEKTLLKVAGNCFSIIFDYLIKAMGKTNLTLDNFGNLPIVDSIYDKEIIIRTLLLSCLNERFSELWNRNFDVDFNSITWSKEHDLLDNNLFKKLENYWNYDNILKNDYIRRHTLVEIDVLVAKACNLNLEDLLSIYMIQFPVLNMYEDDTWYDKNGRIIFTNNRSLTNVGFSRPEFEQIKDAKPGEKFYRTIIDDTMPGGPTQRTIEYVAPFDKCDRIEDYKTAWEFFTKKYESEE